MASYRLHSGFSVIYCSDSPHLGVCACGMSSVTLWRITLISTGGLFWRVGLVFRSFIGRSASPFRLFSCLFLLTWLYSGVDFYANYRRVLAAT